MASLSPLQKMRLQYQPKLPQILLKLKNLVAEPILEEATIQAEKAHFSKFFPKTIDLPALKFSLVENLRHEPKRVGVVLSGGQAAGGHNVISGLYDALKLLHPNSRLFGFYNGPKGIIKNKSVEITADLLLRYRNQGGFDLIGSGRDKIEQAEEFKLAENTMRALDLDGLVIIGGDDSNTNAAFLAEYFLQNACKTCVVGVPKTIDGDLKSDDVEISFGFDTACKVFSEIIGNIAKDCLSAKKSYYFIKLMGRSASHVTLECALQTHPNIALISEEVLLQKKTLLGITQDICDTISERAALKKNFGVILIPEGIVEFIPEFKSLISELNSILDPEKPHHSAIEKLISKSEKIAYVANLLSKPSSTCLSSIPEEIQEQLLFDRDPHGNLEVSKIETERLFIEMVKKELKKRKKEGTYLGKFNGQPHFCGYEGRSGLPSNFDAQYCYALGHVAAVLINSKATGYLCTVKNLIKPVEEWQIMGKNLISMMAMENRRGKAKPVIRKALVDLQGIPFKVFKQHRLEWKLLDDYCCPGPLQFFGPAGLTEATTLTLAYERSLIQ